MSATTPVRAALDAVGQARLGADVGDLLLDCARSIAASGDFSPDRLAAERALQRALFAGPRRDGVRYVVESAAARARHAPLEVVGLSLQKGDPLHEPWPDNPWGVPPAATVPEALDALWMRTDASRFLRLAKNHVCGLALLRDARGTPAVGYLVSSATPSDRRSAMTWDAARRVKLFVGCAPDAEPKVDSDIDIPAPLRAFYRVHGGLYAPGFGEWSLASPSDLTRWSDMLGHTEPTAVDAEDEAETVDSDELLGFFSYGDDRTDLFELSGDEDPPVRSWGDGVLYRAREEPEGFWAWFGRNADWFLSG